MSIQAPTMTIGAGYRPAPTDPANPTHASTTMVGGQAVFENDNYRITMGDNNTVTINNKHTGETYQAWGDPHMKIDGKQAFDFWGTTTLALEDGTKVTIETTPWAHNSNMTLSSKVTITNGDYGVQVSGIDTNNTGDLKIDEAKGWGQVLDWAVDDGNVLHENPAGKGFVAVDDNGLVRKVDQTYINETDLLKGGALTKRFADIFRSIGGLLSISFSGWLLSAVSSGTGSGAGAAHGRGSLSSRYETSGRGPGTVSTGRGDHGGVSYGSYQLASNAGRPAEFLAHEGQRWAAQFAGQTQGTPAFSATWRRVAQQDPAAFAAAQHAFIERTHYNPAVERIARRTGLDVNGRSAALQDVVWSTAVQQGPGNMVVQRAVQQVDARMSRNDPNYDRELIKAVYAERGRRDPDGKLHYFRSSSPAVQQGVARRFVAEQADALRMLHQR